MKKCLALVLTIVIAALSFTFVAMAELPAIRFPATYAELYVNGAGYVYAYDKATEKGTKLEDVDAIGNSSKVMGFVNGFLINEADFDFVNGVKIIRGKEVLLGRSTVMFSKIEPVNSGFRKLPREVQDYLMAYGSDWARPLLDETLVYDGSYVSHRATKYNSKNHILVAQYFFGTNATEYMGVFYDLKEDNFTLCKAVNSKVNEAEDPTPTPKPTRAPTEKPTRAPTEKPTRAPTVKPTATPKPTRAPTEAPTRAPTEKPTATPIVTPKPTATPIVTPKPTSKPTATPRVTPEPEKPGDNDDGGYGDNPLEDLVVKPTAKPHVTAAPERPGDNDDGGVGDNPLDGLYVPPIDNLDGGYGDNPLGDNNGGKVTAKPGTTPKPSSGGNPLDTGGGTTVTAKPEAKPVAKPAATAKPAAKPAATTQPAATAKPAAKPAATTQPAATAKPANTGNPLDNGDGGYGSNPLGF